MDSIVYLVKASNGLVSHCDCAIAPVGFPAQMSCPWCGCGWLFTCVDCQMAFAFAKGVELNESWESIAYRDMSNRLSSKPTEDMIEGWVEDMQEMHEDVIPGMIYVCLDGLFIPATAEGVNFDGWHAAHTLDFVPQIKALTDDSVVERILANPKYWKTNELPPEGVIIH